MPMATQTHTTDRPVLAVRCLDPDIAAAARVFLATALRAMAPQTKSDFDTYQRLAQHEDRVAAAADADGRHQAADTARTCAARYRADAYAMVARLPLAAVAGALA
jgi:hypothetical protein